MRLSDKAGGKPPKAQRRKALTRRTAPKAARHRAAGTADLREQLDQRTRELDEALQQQTATSEVLRVISSSLGELQPVFDAMLENATHICAAKFGILYRWEGDALRTVATHGAPQSFVKERQRNPMVSPSPDTTLGRALSTKQPVQIADIRAEIKDFDTRAAQLPKLAGARTVLTVPMIKGNELLGAILIYRQEVLPFTDKQIELVENFATQAAIAIENTRLLNELRESLQQQTATADVLKIIGSSPRDMKAVFEAMLVNALRICDAKFGHILLYDGERFHATHLYDVPPSYRAFWDQHGPIRPSPKTGLSRLARTKQVVHIPDLKADPTYTEREPLRVVTVEQAGARSFLAVPMLKETKLVGAIVIYRTEVRPFSDRQIELVENFAAQAVIAMENARLVAETREALEQRTATAEVLRVINSSPGNLAPVFEAILEKAHGLCDVTYGSLQLYDSNEFRAVAVHGLSDAFAERLRQGYVPGPNHLSRRLMEGERFAQTPDIGEIDDPISRAAFEHSGIRTALFIPLRKEGRLIGQIVAARREVRPFIQKEIALLENFAAQAVIAMENARLFNETKEALERQTATADVLKVIASSPSDVQPVFDAIARRANTLIGGFSSTVFRFIDGIAYLEAFTPTTPAADEVLKATFPRPVADYAPFRMAQAGEVAQIADTEASTYQLQNISRARGYRSMLYAPLMSDGMSIGFIAVTRVQPGTFPDHHVQLLRTFADQAVIAIENARLFEEVQAKTRDLEESLQQQTATADVLKVISRSAFDLPTVLQTLVESAARLCDADKATITRQRDGVFYRAESYGFTDEFMSFVRSIPMIPDCGSASGRALLEGTVVHIPDVKADPDYTFNEAQRLGDFRAILAVPMLREGVPVGVIVLNRSQVRPFTDKQIELATTFADQAAIAIENVRLFDEVQARTRELSEALTYQTGSSNILSVIASSPTDVGPVLAAIVESACELCDASDALVFLKDGEDLRFSAHHGSIPIDLPKWPINRNWVTGRAVVDRVPVHVRDLPSEGDDFPEGRELARHQGHRTVLSVPLLREGESIGAISLRRTEVHPFNDKQIALLQTFADQAVIAIGNVRLFQEVQSRTRDLTESLQQQTATAEVLKVISASPGELEPVFQAMLENAVRLCEAKFAQLFLYEEEENGYRAVGGWNLPPAWSEFLGKNRFRADPMVPLGRVATTKQPVQVADVLADQAYIDRYPGMVAVAELGGARTLLQVPMLKENELVGAFGIYRQEVRPFTDKQVALVQNFAAQAVIAIENARLLNELRQRTEDLTASLDDLRTAQDRLIQTEKLASLGQLTAGIAHEIKNPLNFVNNFSGLSVELVDELAEGLKAVALDDNRRAEFGELTETLRGNLQKVVQHGERADAIVKNMLLHSRQGSGEHRRVEINALVEESLNLAYHGARAEKQGFEITLERSFDPAAGEVDLFPQEITRVLLNLISNGFYAATMRRAEANGGDYEPTLAAATKNLGNSVEIRIRDNGAGIPPEVKEKMFNPFFTTKPAGEGTGLGLSISHDIIVKQHNGSIDFDTQPGEFTEFRIVLPRGAATVAKPGERP
jgi:two-component system, NtrC family, sensor kinase